MPAPLVLRTKIIPPRPTIRTLARPRIAGALAESLDYRVTLLQAGAGYGKSTALGSLALDYSVIWYQLSEEDNDPLVFFLHLCRATERLMPDLDGLPIPLLESWEGSQGPLPSAEVVKQYLNGISADLEKPTLLVLDDIHLVADSPEIAQVLDRLIAGAPPDLHFILSARPPLKLPNLNYWRARGQILDLDQSTLLFTVDEIQALFAQNYHYELTTDEAESLERATEGWAITLQLIWQSLRSGAAASVDEALARSTNSLESLFDVLAKEVFGRQPEDVQEFMRVSATLRVMTPGACDALLADGESAAMLGYLKREELFIVDLGDSSIRYHHIFHRFLRQMTTEDNRRLWHSRAATYFEARLEFDEAIYHLLRAQDYAGAAGLLASFGDQLLAMGRLDSLAAYLDELPPETLHQHAELLTYLGDLARLHSRFQESLGWYQEAEALWRERGQPDGVGRALRGQARVYLDTVNPTKAEELLQQALRLSDGTVDREAQARLYELLAENKLNSGKLDEAESLRHQARALRQEGPDESDLYLRVLLRTGRLNEARQKLEARAQVERQEPVQTPRAHRETQLLLSIIYAFEGQAEAAFQAALEGTRRGVELNSPYVIAIGHMRQGHALMLLPGEGRMSQAREQLEKAVEFSRTLSIPRLEIEANWSLCRVYGYQGDLAKARAMAARGIEIATQYGDDWISSLIQLTLGGSLTLAGRYEAADELLSTAIRGFEACSDPFGWVAARLWQCLGWYRQGSLDRVAQSLPEALSRIRTLGYDYLLTRPTFLGPPTERMLVPLLLLARDEGWDAVYCRQLLQEMQLEGIAMHPGYQFRVQTLGGFQAWRGHQAIPNTGWRREKARQLFQLLLTFRQAPLDRDQILEYLWPDSDPEAAGRNFKVALSTMFGVLEPERPPGTPSAYILREGNVYGVRPGADIWLDAAEFLDNIQEGEASHAASPLEAIAAFERGLDVYHGDYLPELRYEAWAAEEREHLVVRFLQAADQLASLYVEAGRADDAIRVSQVILAQDNCWERAYRHLMRAYHQMGDQGQVARTYQRCVQTLGEELQVSPAQETVRLYGELTRVDQS